MSKITNPLISLCNDINLTKFISNLKNQSSGLHEYKSIKKFLKKYKDVLISASFTKMNMFFSEISSLRAQKVKVKIEHELSSKNSQFFIRSINTQDSLDRAYTLL